MAGIESGVPRKPRAGRGSGLSGPVVLLLLLLHVTGLGLWVALNIGLVPRVPAFDPYPFHLLTLIASSEAVLLCLVVLIRLGRMEARAEERYRLALRAGLLVEEEVVEAARTLERVEARLGGGHGSTNPRPGGGADERRPRPEH
jgi:uncharacterized membrane protein